MHTGIQRIMCICVGIVLVAGSIHGCTASSAPPAPREKSITFCTDWTVPWSEWILWENGIAGGFYKKHHLQVLLEKPSVPQESLNMLATGWCDIGYTYQTDLMVLRVEKYAPIEAIATFFPHNRWGIAYLRSEEIQTPGDLRGKQISLYNLQTDHSYFKLWLTQNGYTPEDFVLVEGGDWNTEILHAGHAHAASAWENSEIPFLEFANPGSEVVFLPVTPQTGLPYLTVMAVNSRFLQRHPDATRRFLAATYESLVDAVEYPERAVKRFLARHTEIPVSEHPRWYSAWQRAISTSEPKTGGHIDSTRWNQALKSLATIGVLPQNLEDNTGYTNHYCPEVSQP